MGSIMLTEIDKVYENGFHAVHKLTLDVADGEFLVLLARPAVASRPRCA